MCAGNCSGKCGCAPQSKVQPPVRGIPGPVPEITWNVIMIGAGSTPTVIVSGVPPVYNVTIGIPYAFSPTFGENVVVNMLPAGSAASGSIDNTDPLNPILTLNLPSAQDGEDGVNAFTNLSASFVQPAAGGLVTVTVGSTEWMSIGSWVYVQGGGHYVVASNPLSATQIVLRNPGASDLLPYWGGSVTSIPTNVAAASTITPSGASAQVMPSGVPGPIGPSGTIGTSPSLPIVYTVPVDPPVSDAVAAVFYFNAAPPNVATTARLYSYNEDDGWVGGPNFAGPGGVQAFSGSADPNTTPPSGSNIGDLYFRSAGSTYTMYQRVSVSTWSVIWGPIPDLGSQTLEIDHTSGPGTETLDTAYFSYLITANKDLGLDHDDTNYTGQGSWVVQVNNTDASDIELTFASGRWEQDPALTISTPYMVPNGGNTIIEFRRNMVTGLYIVTNIFDSSALSS